MTAQMSLRVGFEAIGDSSIELPAYRSGLVSPPRSLREGITDMLANPEMGKWTRVSPEVHADENWSEECQGIAFDGQRFITSSNGSAVSVNVKGVNLPNPGYSFNQSPKALYRFRPHQYSFHDSDIQETFFLGGDPHDHLGDIDYYKGSVYCAIETHGGGTPQVLRVTADQGPLGKWSSSITMHGVEKSGQNHSFPWCAINPFNGLLYSSPFYDNGGHEVFAYDPASGEWAGSQYTIQLTRPAYRVQGGCFSPRGHLYLASDRAETVSSGETVTFPSSDVHLVGVSESGPAKRRKFILCYSAFNGQYLGRAFVDALEKRQELEGLCYGPGVVGGHAVQLHVVLLENEPVAKDNVYVKPYAAPDANRV